jgi:chromosome segregation ATPase
MDPVRVRVPRAVWDAVRQGRSHGNRGTDSRERFGGNGPERGAGEIAELRERVARQEATIEGLQALVARLEADRQAMAAEVTVARQEAQEARQIADRRAMELAEVRERAGRAEAEGEAADRRARELAVERDQAVHQVEAVREELAAWRMGGPIARAVRAFLYRRPA